MKMKKLTLAAISAMLLTGCGRQQLPASDPAPADEPVAYASDLTAKPADDAFCEQQTAFALDLFRRVYQTAEQTNTMISPYSVMQALAMTANGAAGENLKQMEQVLGGGTPIETLDRYLYGWRLAQPHTNRCKLNTANAIWVQEGNFSVKQDFLQINREWFGADCFRAPFDQKTLGDINSWVNEHTDRMIPEIIDSFNPNDRMVLVNAVSFDAKWQTAYESEDVKEADFTNADGNKIRTEMMYSDESIYLSHDGATGFLRYYDGPYAFAGILPPEDMTVSAYLEQLDGKSLRKMLTKGETAEVRAGIPSFSYDTDATLNQVLSEMGMPMAFGAGSDFSGMTESVPLMIGRVLHKTHIDVDAEGTKAAAATAATMTFKADPMEKEKKTVILNRPFLYMIVDTNTNLPVFIGTVQDLQGA